MTPQWLVRVLRALGLGGRLPPFAAGQVWRYATRNGEEASRAHVLRLDTHPGTGELIVHVAVTDVHIAGGSMTIGHIPISREALERSGLALDAGSAPLPDFEEGYQTWRSEFDAGNAGVFTIPLAAVVEVMDRAVQRGS